MSEVPSDVMELIRKGEIKRLKEAEAREEKTRVIRAENEEKWRRWTEDVRNLIPDELKPWMIVTFELDREPYIYDEVRIEVPGLAPMRAMIKSPINRMEINTWEVSCPLRTNDGDGYYIAVKYEFGTRTKSFRDVEMAVLEASLQEEFADQLRQQALEDQERYKNYLEGEDCPCGREPVYETLDETMDDGLIRALRGLIKAEIEKSL